MQNVVAVHSRDGDYTKYNDGPGTVYYKVYCSIPWNAGSGSGSNSETRTDVVARLPPAAFAVHNIGTVHESVTTALLWLSRKRFLQAGTLAETQLLQTSALELTLPSISEGISLLVWMMQLLYDTPVSIASRRQVILYTKDQKKKHQISNPAI